MSNEENNIKFGEFPTTNIQDVDLPTAIEMAKNKVMSTLNCHNIGKIVEFNTQNQTATVEVVAQKQYNGNTYGLPLLLDVPCFIYGGNNQYITMGDLVGSYCLLVFMDRNIDNFMLTGAAYVPATGRMHDWSDCVALCGFNPLTNVIDDYNNEAIEVRNFNTKVKVSDKIELDSKDDITITAPEKITLNAPDTETTGNFKVATGYTGVIPCGLTAIQVTNGIITGVV